MRLFSNPASPYVPTFQYAPIFEQPVPPCHLFQAEKVITPELLGPQKWLTYQNEGIFICYRYKRLHTNSIEVQAPYAPIFLWAPIIGYELMLRQDWCNRPLYDQALALQYHSANMPLKNYQFKFNIYFN